MKITAANKNQNLVFSEGEADRWYSRNKLSFEKTGVTKGELPLEIEGLCTTLEPFKQELNKVLEIGCSSGKKLEAICNVLDAFGEGLDPSQLAVDEGNRRLLGKDIRLVCGTSNQLPYDSGLFDVVYFGFCLVWVDRQNLLMALAEADRVLRPGGFLAITDFDPGMKCKRPYIHKEGIFSYKQDYSKFYTESGLYYLVSKQSFSHRQTFFDLDTVERVSLSVLYKELEPYPLCNAKLTNL